MARFLLPLGLLVLTTAFSRAADPPAALAALNFARDLSERFAEGFVAAALGLPVRTGILCFAITCAKYEDIRTLKLRVLSWVTWSWAS